MNNNLQQRFDELNKLRMARMYNLNYRDRVIIFNSYQGTGKSRFNLAWLKDHYDISIILVNNHRAALEIRKELIDLNIPSYNIVIPCSKTHKLSDDQKVLYFPLMTIRQSPDYLCAGYDQPFFQGIMHGYEEQGSCDDCPLKPQCRFNDIINYTTKVIPKLAGPKFAIMVKAYLKAAPSIVKRRKGKYKGQEAIVYNSFIIALINVYKNYGRTALMFDENFLNECIIEFDYNNIERIKYFKFKTFFNRMLELNPELNDFNFYDRLEQLLETIFRNDITINYKKRYIIQLINGILKDFFINRFRFWNKWFNVLNNTVKNNINNIDTIFAYNILRDVGLILKNAYITQRKGIDLASRIYVDDRVGHPPNFLYSIDNKPQIVKIISLVQRIFIASAGLIRDDFINTMPQYQFNVKVIETENISSQFKWIKYLTTGKYIKPTLKSDIQHHNELRGEDSYYTEHFDRLMQHTKDILEAYPDITFLIGAYKEFRGEVDRQLSEFNNYDYEWWFILEGSNIYNNNLGVIVFGLPGIPRKILKIKSNILGIPMDRLEEIYTIEQQLQFVERIRTFLYPNVKICFILTKIIHPLLKDNAIGINKIHEMRYKDFIDKIKEKNGVDLKQSLELYNLCYNPPVELRYIRDIMLELVRVKVLMEQPIRTGRVGRPKKVYMVL